MQGELPGDGRFKDVHEERLTHRLEGFSDIVLGFSLGEMALNFAIPHRALEVFSNPSAIIAFAVTFLVVSIFWYAHHRLFEYFFVPNTFNIALNFVTLGLVVWLVYELQVYVHFANLADHAVAASSYLVTFAIVWVLLGVLYGASIKVCWLALDPSLRRSGVAAIGRLFVMAAGTLIGVAVFDYAGWPPEICFWLIPVWALLWRAVAPAVLARMEGVAA